MTTVIIPSAGLCTSLGPLCDHIPKSLLMVGNKTMLMLQYEHYLKFYLVDKFVVLVAARYLTLVTAYCRVQDMNVEVFEVEYGRGSLDAVQSYVENSNIKSNIVLNWSDVLLTSPLIDTGLGVDGVRVAVSPNKDCRFTVNDDVIKNSKDGSGDLLGVYYFDNAELLKELFETKLYDIADALQFNKTRVTTSLVKCAETGCLASYLDASNEVTSRDFNNVEITNNIVTKKSLTKKGHKLIALEKKWYSKCHKFFRPDVIRSYGNTLITQRIEAPMLCDTRFDTPRQYEVLLRLKRFILVMSRHVEGKYVTREDAVKDIDIEATMKMAERVSKVKPIIDSYSVKKVNGVKIDDSMFDMLVSLLKINVPSYYGFFHGDINFSNVFVSNNMFKLIDPRAHFGKSEMFGPLSYEMAKLTYACSGYDKFSSNKSFTFDIDTEGHLRFNIEVFVEGFEDFFDTNDLLWLPIIWRALSGYLSNDPVKCMIAYYHSYVIAEQIIDYLGLHAKARYVIDLDDTLGEWNDDRKYNDFAVIDKMRLKVNQLYNQGNHITICTARGRKSGADDDFINSTVRFQIRQWLACNDISYHKLSFNKEYANVYIDDKAVTI